ncbi:MAG TPA: MFS transporter [Woeseiaceae bacterium]|jgi:PAT family beta-lactamase induction signal transducer AmpG|nr:MFS transporter [Woeseiaceae bacterium]
MNRKNLLDSRKGRLTTFGLLYVSEGIPYGFTSVAMVTFMRTAGISLEQIGIFVAALFIPWSFKFAWAPLIDLVKLNRLGGRKAWIMGCLVMMIVTLVVTALVDFQNDFRLLLAMVVLNNMFCATQDVAIDSLAVSTLKPDERASGNGFMFGGQYSGIAMGGGGAVFVFGIWGFNAALFYISALQLVCLLFVLFFVRDPRAAEPTTPHVGSIVLHFLRTLREFLWEVYTSFMKSGRSPRIGLLFSLMPIGALVLGYAALTTIQVDYGFSEMQIARTSALNTIAGAIGCVVGGLLADRFGMRRMLGLYYLLSALPGLVLATYISNFGLAGVPIEVIYATLIGHGFLYGLSFGVHAAIFMGMTNPAVAATQFTAFMAMSNVAISYTNYWQGVIAERFDYALVLYVDALLIILPLFLIPFLRSREEDMALATSS